MGERRSLWSCWAMFGLIFGVVLGYCALFVHYGWNEADEGVLLAQYYRTYAGETPVRDFHIGYTPGGYYFHAWLFQWFGPTVPTLRWALAVCHGLSAAWLFAVGRRVMGGAFACLAPLTYVSILPFFPGEFALFNVPYPSWWGVLFMVAGLWVLLRWIETGRLACMAAAGLLTGIAFSFKPNVGLFQLAMNGLVVLLVHEPRDRRDAVAWWTLLVGVVGGLVLVFASQATPRDGAIFLLPILVVCAVLAARQLRVAPRPAASPGRLLGCALVFGGMVLVPVLPWVVHFLAVLGPAWFTRALLFVGSGFEHFYYVSFRSLGPWDAVLALAVVGLGVLGALLRRGLLRPHLVAGAAVLAAAGVLAVVWRAPMPEGFRAAVVSRVDDLSFTASLIVHWVALAAYAPVLWSRSRDRRDLLEGSILLGALVMSLKLYPRSDFAHLVVAVPLTLVLGARLADRVVAGLPEAAGLRRLARLAVPFAIVALVLLRIAPNLGSVLVWDGGPSWRAHATLGLERAPLGLEVGREPRVRALSDTVRFVRANTAPGERLFTFPAIEALCFLSDRTNATRHGYFFTGWPGHEVEAEVVAALTADPPRLMVTFERPQLFFLYAPAYYLVLRQHVRTHYREVARFGPYAVLAHRAVPDTALVSPATWPSGAGALAARYGAQLRGDPSTRARALGALTAERLQGAWPPAVALLADDDPAVRTAALAALASVTDPAIGPPLIEALQSGRVPTRFRLAVLRRILAIGDARVIGEVVEMLVDARDPRERRTLLLTLEMIALKLALRDYAFAGAAPLTMTSGPLHDIGRWTPRLLDPAQDPKVRTALVRILSRIDAPALGPTLCHLLDRPAPPELRSAAAGGLLRVPAATRACDPLDALLTLVASEPVFAPSLLVQRYAENDTRAHRGLRQALDDATHGAPLVWTAAATGDPRLRGGLLRRLEDTRRDVRLAALAGLERIADPAVAASVRRVGASDPDQEVRASAARVLRTLGSQAPLGVPETRQRLSAPHGARYNGSAT